MPKVGIEPTLPEGNRILSPARLPVPPLRLGRWYAAVLVRPDLQREVRRREEEADARVGAALAEHHLACRADAADRDEAELARRGAVARARDVDVAEPLERRPARLPIAEREKRMDGAARRGIRRSPSRPRPPHRSASASSSGLRAIGVGRKKTWYGSCVGRANMRRKRSTRMTMPPSTTGNASRHSPSACPSADLRGRERVRRLARRGTASCSGSRARARRAARRASRPAARSARSRASACATDGGPASTAAAVRIDRAASGGTRRRTGSGVAENASRSGERRSARRPRASYG